MNKLVIILGPTSSGKSSLAIKLAKKFNGEIISADSRQVYKGLDIGTGKVTKKEQKLVLHHLLDVVSPKKQYTVAKFKKLAEKKIKTIQKKNKLPFLVGGTAFYIYAVIDDLKLPDVKPDKKLRLQLSKQSTEKLFKLLKIIDSKRARSIDSYNRVRLIRAIEINIETGKPVPPRHLELNSGSNDGVLILGLKKAQKELYQLIDKRLDQRLKQGLVTEVKKLHKKGLSYKRLDELGLEYRFVSKYLQGKLGYDDMVQKLKAAIHQFSKRQMTWWKKDKRVIWIKNQNQAKRLLSKFFFQ